MFPFIVAPITGDCVRGVFWLLQSENIILGTGHSLVLAHFLFPVCSTQKVAWNIFTFVKEYDTLL